MMMYRYLWLAILAGLMLVACEGNQEEVSLNLPAYEEGLIIECYLEPGENYRALVTKTLDFFEAKESETVDSVSISLFVDGTEKVLRNMPVADTLYNKVYNYWLPEKVKYEAGKEYQISVAYGDKVRATGKTRFLPKVKVREPYFKFDKEVDSLASVFVEIEDFPGEENFYRIVMRGLNPSLGHTYEGLWDDVNAADGVVTAITGYNFFEGAIVVVNVYHLEKSYYRFLKSVTQAKESNYNPFMQPAGIKSTLEGATGVFSAVTLTSDTIIVKR